MAKQLRLDVAQLTDVGRKREHNEDNMAYVIPKDPQVMARKGALFIVADGMGGHAAGEVASEIAVDTVSNAYYQDENDDVPGSLLQAIRRANAAIHQRAAENMLRSGMGTTCVAAVLRGNVAYIANIGDSRAYFVRKSRIYQISQDHSWVAEQVRAGLLTEEQARTHAQRNVITRSLGTQVEVEVDMFREVLEEGDTLILCSDGLSGLVNDEDLLRLVDQFVPQESVYHLVERANENGGPDNITAIVARVQEVGVEPVNARQPVPVGGSEISNEDTARIFAPPPGMGMHLPSRSAEPAPQGNNPFAYTRNTPLPAPEDSDTAPQPGVLIVPRRRGRLFYPTLVLLILFLLVAGLGGGYYLLHSNQTQTINSTLNSASSLISQANGEVKKNPTQALRDLASAQQKLESLKQSYSLSTTESAQLSSLQNQLVSATRAAILQYNTNGLITLWPCSNASPTSDLNTSTANQLAVLYANNTSQSYTVGQDGKVYQLAQSSSGANTNQITLSKPFQPSNAQVISLAGGRERLFTLNKQGASGAPATFTITLLTPLSDGSGLQAKKTVTIDTTQIPQGAAPQLITAWNDGSTTSVYVILNSTTSGTDTTILAYTVENSKNTFSAPVESKITTSYPVVSVAAIPAEIYFLLSDGQIWSSAIRDDHTISADASTQVNPAIANPLSGSPVNFSAKNTVPMATVTTQSGNVPLAFPQAQNVSAVLTTALVTGNNGSQEYHLFIGDPANHRVLELGPSNAPVATAGGQGSTPTATTTSTSQNGGLTLVRQYASPDLFNTIKGIAIDPNGSNIDVLGQDRSSAQGNLVVIPSSLSQTGCAS